MFDVTIMRCLRWRSTQTPTNSPNSSHGIVPAKFRIPSSKELAFRMMIAVSGNASPVNWLPNCDIVSEVQRLRKL